jgi:ATPase subunit of ABC transporter with duplicated ATPase domains
MVENKNKNGNLIFKMNSSLLQKKQALNNGSHRKELKRVKVFEDLNLSIVPRSKVAVVGKNQVQISDFVYTVLGETIVKAGSLSYKGRIIYSDMGNP